MTHTNDNTPLLVVKRPGAQPHQLAQTLSARLTDAAAFGPAGELALGSAGSGCPELGQGKTVSVGSERPLSCTPIPAASVSNGPNKQQHVPALHIPPAGTPGSGVSLAPAWSPDGRLLAYVKAPVAQTGGSPAGAWYRDHILYVWSSATGRSDRLEGTTGASDPAWSADGQQLLFVRADGLWITSLSAGKPVEIERPLYPLS